MPKLRLAVILQILIMCLDFPVALWQSHVDAEQHRKDEYPIVYTVTLAYLGLNAPAVVFQGLCVAGVVPLCFSVWLFLDRRRICPVHRQTATTVWRVLGTLLLLAFAIVLFGGGVFVMRHRPSGNPVGDVL